MTCMSLRVKIFGALCAPSLSVTPSRLEVSAPRRQPFTPSERYTSTRVLTRAEEAEHLHNRVLTLYSSKWFL